jgi:hypothetical protein
LGIEVATAVLVCGLLLVATGLAIGGLLGVIGALQIGECRSCGHLSIVGPGRAYCFFCGHTGFGVTHALHRHHHRP